MGSVPAFGSLTADTEFLRIRVEGTEEDAQIASAETVVLPQGSVRPAPLGGAIALVSYADETPLEIRYVDLSLDISYGVNAGALSYTFVDEAERGSSDLFVVRDPALTHLALMNGEETLQRIAVGELSGKLGSGMPFLQVGTASGNTVPGYPHIVILGAGDDELLPESFTGSGWQDHEGNPSFVSLAEPTPAYVDYFRRAFERVQPEVAATIRSVGVVNLRGAGQTALPASVCESASTATPRITGGAKVGTFLINSYTLDHSPDAAEGTLVHETAHVFHEAIDKIATHGSGYEFILPDTDSFLRERRILIPFVKDPTPPEANAVAARDSYERGIWEHTHHTAVEAGLAQMIPSAMDRAVGASIPGPDFWLPRYCDENEAISAGSASIYGASSFAEDIAEFARAIQYDPAGSRVCVHMRDNIGAERIGREALVHVAKASILRQAGFVSDANFRRCVGELPQAASPGILMNNEQGELLLDHGVAAGFGELNGKKFFRVTAEHEASSYAGLFMIYTPRHVTPVGLHQFGESAFGLDGFRNEFLLNHDSLVQRRASGGGLVIITEALDGEVHGAMIRVPLRFSLGISSVVPYAPFWVPGN